MHQTTPSSSLDAACCNRACCKDIANPSTQQGEGGEQAMEQAYEQAYKRAAAHILNISAAWCTSAPGCDRLAPGHGRRSASQSRQHPLHCLSPHTCWGRLRVDGWVEALGCHSA
eukprot:5439-Chlamydomonas_euryale.AAC.3